MTGTPFSRHHLKKVLKPGSNTMSIVCIQDSVRQPDLHTERSGQCVGTHSDAESLDIRQSCVPCQPHSVASQRKNLCRIRARISSQITHDDDPQGGSPESRLPAQHLLVHLSPDCRPFHGIDHQLAIPTSGRCRYLPFLISESCWETTFRTSAAVPRQANPERRARWFTSNTHRGYRSRLSISNEFQ
jgi:hypothetical protein